MKHALVVVVVAFVVTLSGAATISGAGTSIQQLREGRKLSTQQVSKLEARLKANPDDLATRARLLGYYYVSAINVAGPEATRAARRHHILWMIENHPENEITLEPELCIDSSGHTLADAEGYGQAKQLWLQQIDRHKDDARVLVHAARFVQLSDKAMAITCLTNAIHLSPDDRDIASRLAYSYAITVLGITMINNNGLPMSADPVEAQSALAKTAADELRASSNPVVVAVAGSVLSQYGPIVSTYTSGAINHDALSEDLLLRAAALNPNDPDPPLHLGNLYSSRMLGEKDQAQRRTLAQKALVQDEMVVRRTAGDREAHLYALIAASKAAMDAEAFDKARGFATDLLKLVGDPPDTRDGNAFHDGHVVLGRLTLKDGDIQQAKAHLLQAGRARGGGMLTSFGPNMSLAKELADRGERETVIRYLELCRSFWHTPQLDQWIVTLMEGKTPNFGANLIY